MLKSAARTPHCRFPRVAVDLGDFFFVRETADEAIQRLVRGTQSVPVNARIFAKCWSEWQDLNLRPPRPERGALPPRGFFPAKDGDSRG